MNKDKMAHINQHIQWMEKRKDELLVQIAELKSNYYMYESLISKAYGDITLLKGSKE